MEPVMVKSNQIGRRIKIASTLVLLLSSSSSALELPKKSSFFVMDGSCCGGEESDPHAVHGFETAKGNLIWQRASSFAFDDDDNVPSTASEWVFTTRHGDLASVVDLDFGIGIELLK